MGRGRARGSTTCAATAGIRSRNAQPPKYTHATMGTATSKPSSSQLILAVDSTSALLGSVLKMQLEVSAEARLPAEYGRNFWSFGVLLARVEGGENPMGLAT